MQTGRVFIGNEKKYNLNGLKALAENYAQRKS